MTQWRLNTDADPFWGYKGPVQIQDFDNRTRTLRNPLPYKPSMPLIRRWRPVRYPFFKRIWRSIWHG